jgi:RimJ/RimL family protein N-acetyltransferase
MHVRTAGNSDLETIAGWLAEPRIARWLDFGMARPPPAAALKYAISQGSQRLFTFAPAHGRDVAPIGVVGLSGIHPTFRTALLWYALGAPRYAGRGFTSMAAAEVVRIGFSQLDLRAIHAWVVIGNQASARILEKIGFRPIGRQRQCHDIDGRLHDRLLFDIVPRELADQLAPVVGKRRVMAIANAVPAPFSVADGAILLTIPWG